MTNKKRAKVRKLAELGGWYGMFAILLAYALLSFKYIKSNGWAYQVLNLSGAIGIIIISTIKRVKQTLVLNIVWSVIALVALVHLASS